MNMLFAYREGSDGQVLLLLMGIAILGFGLIFGLIFSLVKIFIRSRRNRYY